jgi:protocatechuate 3,4-dioxygenase beta subunit/peroxiredoxin
LTADNLKTELGPLPPRTLTTDAQGNVQVPVGNAPAQTLRLRAAKEGFGSEQSNWENGNVPGELTLKLSKAVAIGGRVQDEGGQPISGATVQINGLSRDEVGQVVPIEYESVKTDQDGKWAWSRLPKSAASLNFKVTHPEFMPAEYDQATPDNTAGKIVTRDSLASLKAVMVMEPGIRLEGTVADSQGQPIARAEVMLASGENLGKRQKVQTDTAGHFRFALFEAVEAQLFVQAKGYAPEHRPISIERGIKPISYTLAKGNSLRGRVTDESGQPVEGAAVAVGSWDNLPLLSWRAQTDSDGRFTWDSAPSNPVSYAFTKAGFNLVTQEIVAGASEETTIRLAKTFKLSGKVIDAETKEPVKSFSLMRGRVWNSINDEQISWEPRERTPGVNGAFTLTLDNRDGSGERVKFILVAEGYQPASTASYDAKGWHTNDFELKKGGGPQGIVQSPDGRPVEGAQVAISGIGYLSLAKASFRNLSQAETFSAKTDAQGHFSLPAVLASPTIIAVHEQGYAEANADQLAKSPNIVLQPWGRIEGTMMIGSKPGVKQSVMVAPKNNGPNSVNYDFETYKAETDEQGHFTFTYVPPGARQLVRLISSGSQRWTWSNMEPLTVKPGEVTQVTYGGQGRAVIGKLISSDPARKIDWQAGHHSLSTKIPRPPRALKSQEEYRAWYQTPEVKAAMEKQRHYGVQISEDGSFRVDDIPAATYQLSFYFTEGGDMGGGKTVGTLNKEVVVPEMPGGRSDEPLDVGQLTVVIQGEPKDGDEAPKFEVKTLDGKPLKLTDYRGKHVLLDFWASSFGNRAAEVPALKDIYAGYAKDGKLVMISLSLDQDLKDASEFVKKHGLEWIQGVIGDPSEAPFLQAYNFQGLPATYLIGPDGKFLGRNLRGPAIKSALEKALPSR